MRSGVIFVLKLKLDHENVVSNGEICHCGEMRTPVRLPELSPCNVVARQSSAAVQKCTIHHSEN